MKRGFRPLGPCGDDPPGSAPGARAVLHFGEHPALPPGRLEATLGPLARPLDLAFEHPIAGQPHEVPHPMALAPIEHPAPAERRVPPQHDAHPRPRLAASRSWQATRLAHTLSAPPHRGEAHRGRSDLRSPPPPRAPVGAPSSPLRGELSRAGAGHRARAPPARSGPICGPPRAVTTPRRSMKSSRRKNPPAPAAGGSLKNSSHRGYTVSPSGSWLD